MNVLARWVAERWRLAWAVVFGLALLAGGIAAMLAQQRQYEERLSLLQTDAERRGIEVMSQTLNGNVMGALGLLGTIDQELKREARGELTGNRKGEARIEVRGKSVVVSEANLANLESIGRSHDAEGSFVVRADGIIGSGWDNAGKPSTGLNVKFRPYYQMAMQGMENVYAAVSQARGDRMLYFSAPIYAETTNGTDVIGAVVARTGLLKVDNLLRDKTDIALLLSPQKVVFASSRPDWVSMIAGRPTPEQIKAIREVKQFGDLFNARDPDPLPIDIAGGVAELDGRSYAIAGAKVRWNDPLGDWTLVMMEDLSRTVPGSVRWALGSFVALLVAVVGGLMLRMWRGQHLQFLANEEVSRYAGIQKTEGERKTQLAAAGLQMQQARTLEELLQVYFVSARQLIGALQGACYCADTGTPDLLVLAGSYACAGTLPPSLPLGAGLLGQCALERRLAIHGTGSDAAALQFAGIRSGLGEAAPAAMVLLPVMRNEQLLGVVELALLRAPTAADQEQVEALTGLLAMNIEITRRSADAERQLTDILAAEQAQAERLSFQQTLIDTIPYPVFYKDAEARFVGFNQAYEQAFAVRRDDLIGKRVLDLDYLPEADRVAYQAEDEATIASAGKVRHELQIPFADGKLHDTLYFVSGFHRPDGSPGGLVGTFIDISEQKEAMRELDRMTDLERFHKLAHGREERILELKREVNALATAHGQREPYNTELVEPVGDHDLPPNPDYRTEPIDDGQPVRLDELVDLDELQVLLTNFCESVGIASAIIDLEGKVLAAARWQRACTDFHRGNPESCARCIESDTQLALQLKDGQDFTVYRCRNGMTDAAAPIRVEGRHLANVFIGQFHLAPPDLAFFREQAQRFSYDEAAYLEAVQAAPVIAEARLPAILSFLAGFARMISTMSLSRRRADQAQKVLEAQADLLKRERIAALSLAEDAERARHALESMSREVRP